jgi:hypothetical protein
MPLSRHFYALDEVHAALQYATTRNDRIETLFWCNELLHSGCIGETISTLFEAWLWHKGPFHLSWLLHAGKTIGSDEVTEENLLLSAYQLSSIPYTQRDHSLWNILVRTANHDLPDRVTPFTPSTPFTDAQELYFMRALHQGKAYSAWWISRYLSVDRVWELIDWYATHVTVHRESYHACFHILQHYEQLLGYRSDEYDIILRCLAILSVSLSASAQAKSFQPLPSAIDSSSCTRMEAWKEMVGQKSHRLYSIPTACLYGITERGSIGWNRSTLSQLTQIESSLMGCPFWEEALTPYSTLTATIQWNSDEDREAFYDAYFPDDIPDEWNKLEKQRSHGDGILPPKESVQFGKYVRLFLSSIARLSWNRATLSFPSLPCHPSSVISLFTAPKPYEDQLLCPLRRKRI